jgi:cytochrome P450
MTMPADHESGPAPRSLSGPSLLRLLVMLMRSRGDRFAVIHRLVARYGDVVRFRAGHRTFVVCSHPGAVQEVLARQSRHFTKGAFYGRLRNVIGDGLITADGEAYREQRRQVQHLFTARRAAEQAPSMVEVAGWVTDGWADGLTVNVAAEMNRLTLLNTARSFFSLDARTFTDDVLRAIDTLMAELHIHRVAVPLAAVIDRLPLPGNLRLAAARRRLDRRIQGWIDARLRAPRPWPDDVLSAVVADLAEASEGARGVRRRAARDRLLTFLVAGVETTADALTAVFYVLARHESVERRLHEEVDAVVGAASPTIEHVGRLIFLDRVIRETLRIYPPIPSVSRRPREPVTVPGAVLPTGSSVGLSQWQIHHDRRFFARPEAFDPDRWAPNGTGVDPRAYFPFGLGPRRCIGEDLAMLEMKLSIAVVVQRWRLVVAPGVDLKLDMSAAARPKKLTAVVRARW